MNLADIGKDCWIFILSNLSLLDLVHCKKTCKTWNDWISNQFIWNLYFGYIYDEFLPWPKNEKQIQLHMNRRRDILQMKWTIKWNSHGSSDRPRIYSIGRENMLVKFPKTTCPSIVDKGSLNVQQNLSPIQDSVIFLEHGFLVAQDYQLKFINTKMSTIEIGIFFEISPNFKNNMMLMGDRVFMFWSVSETSVQWKTFEFAPDKMLGQSKYFDQDMVILVPPFSRKFIIKFSADKSVHVIDELKTDILSFFTRIRDRVYYWDKSGQIIEFKIIDNIGIKETRRIKMIQAIQDMELISGCIFYYVKPQTGSIDYSIFDLVRFEFSFQGSFYHRREIDQDDIDHWTDILYFGSENLVRFPSIDWQ